MKAIFYGAGAFLLIGLWLFILALQLIPTDLGNSYLIGAFLFVIGAGLLASIGLMGNAMINEIKLLAASPAPRVIEGEPVVTLPQIPISSLPPEEKPEGSKGGMLATGAAAAAAGAVAGGLLGGMTRAEATPESKPSELVAKPDDRFLDDLERDLFADLGKGMGEPKGNIAPEAEVVAEAPDHAASETEDAALLIPAGEAASDAGEGADDAIEPVSVEPDDDAREADDEEPEADEAKSSTPGLIADDDLAALQDDEPVLAPLETLDVVGAYDSGGTRFTMYSDGSVTALGEGVDRRFKSLDALRAFIDGGMKG